MQESKKTFLKKVQEAAEHRLPPVRSDDSHKIAADLVKSYIRSRTQVGTFQSHESGYMGNQSVFRGTPGPLLGSINEADNNSNEAYITLRVPVPGTTPDVSPTYQDVRLTHQEYVNLIARGVVPHVQAAESIRVSVRIRLPWYRRLWIRFIERIRNAR